MPSSVELTEEAIVKGELRGSEPVPDLERRLRGDDARCSEQPEARQEEGHR